MQSHFHHAFMILCIGCMCLVSVYLRWSTVLPWNRTETGDGQHTISVTKKFSTVRSNQWIVVTTISYPTPDIKFLAEIPGWNVVVVGDTKTPRDWRYPNCIFLSLEDQYGLGFETTSHLPERSYARKTVGYLFAIAHGAQIIYETDDDNRPLDLLKQFILEPTMWGLLYKGEKLFNPYRHFGQPTLWPRGYPLGSVGENITLEYELNHWKTPSIQQGVVNGDPDMDAIFRLTRKQTNSQLNVTFDDRAPPAIIPAGVFSPFNSQNTLFLYDALWALLIPTTTTFRVCDIWRGYWAQRLLWEIGGNVGFFPPNAFQKRNSHSYLSDANDEKDLYFQTERLVTFLSKWRCGAEKSFFDCVKQLSKDMCENKFWNEGDVILTSMWIRDLNTIGYEEPKRVPLGSIPDKTLPILSKRIQHQTRNTAEMSKVVFWAAEQTPPLTYSPEIQKTDVLSRLTKSASYCKNYPYNGSIFDSSMTIHTFSNILLIVVFNFPHYQNLDLLETIYSIHFPNILYCGPRKDRFDAYAKHLTKHVSFVEVDVGNGWFSQNCLTQAMKINYYVEGYLYIGDDTLVNVWNLHNLPFDKLWLVDATVLQQSKKTKWHWFNKPSVGLKMYQAALNASKVLDKHRFDSFLQMLARNTKKVDGVMIATSDIAYVPRKIKNDVIYFMEHFSKFNLFVEITIPTVFAGIEKWENVHKMPGMYLWYDGKRNHVEKYFNKNDIFLHPVKLSNVLKKGNTREFFCGTYLPLTMRMSQKE